MTNSLHRLQQNIKPFNIEQHTRLSIYSSQMALIYREVGAIALAMQWEKTSRDHLAAAIIQRGRLLVSGSTYKQRSQL